jgi:hypothetical protein
MEGIQTFQAPTIASQCGCPTNKAKIGTDPFCEGVTRYLVKLVVGIHNFKASRRQE